MKGVRADEVAYRDLLARDAMIAILQNWRRHNDGSMGATGQAVGASVATRAYAIADAMLDERAKVQVLAERSK